MKLENLPFGYRDGQELFRVLDPCGDILEIVAIDPTSIVVTYMMRSSARNCVFALDGQRVLGSDRIRATYFYPKEDPAYSTCPILQSLGTNVGVSSFNYNVSSFKPWSPARGPAVSGTTVIGGKFAAILNKYSVPWKLPTNASEIDDCPICLGPLGERATYNIHSDSSRALELNQCKHVYHQACLEAQLNASTSPFLQCAKCKLVYGARVGTMPANGSISHRTLHESLSGHPGTQTLELSFNFTSGPQGPEHPHPGRPYHAVGFPRKAYLPDTSDGERALHGLYLAFKQRVLFTVGLSQTSGQDDRVTWNDIHVKSERVGAHGYPDPLHLSNLMQELRGFGITEATISSHMAQHPNLKANGRL